MHTYTLTQESIKAQARRLKTYLDSQGNEISYGNALNAIAASYEYRDYNTLLASMKSEPIETDWMIDITTESFLNLPFFSIPEKYKGPTQTRENFALMQLSILIRDLASRSIEWMNKENALDRTVEALKKLGSSVEEIKKNRTHEDIREAAFDHFRYKYLKTAKRTVDEIIDKVIERSDITDDECRFFLTGLEEGNVSDGLRFLVGTKIKEGTYDDDLLVQVLETMIMKQVIDSGVSGVCVQYQDPRINVFLGDEEPEK